MISQGESPFPGGRFLPFQRRGWFPGVFKENQRKTKEKALPGSPGRARESPEGAGELLFRGKRTSPGKDSFWIFEILGRSGRPGPPEIRPNTP